MTQTGSETMERVNGTRYAILDYGDGCDAELAVLVYRDGSRTWEPCARSPFQGSPEQCRAEAQRREEWIRAREHRA